MLLMAVFALGCYIRFKMMGRWEKPDYVTNVTMMRMSRRLDMGEEKSKGIEMPDR